MHKDELLQLHSLLCQMKRFFEDAGVESGDAFEDYVEMEVSPQHIHKSKTDHKRAVFLLAQGFSQVVMSGDPDHRDRLVDRFSKLAEQHDESNRPTSSNEPRMSATDEGLPAFAIAALRR